MQKPPVKSRVKRETRKRRVNTFNIIKMNGREVEFHVDVEAGTYIRKLISDLGELIGGAHMTSLRRIKAGIFDISSSITLKNIERAAKNDNELRKILIPAEIIKDLIPEVKIKDESVKGLLNGSPIMKNDVKSLPESDLISIFNKEKFIGIYKLFNEGDIVAKPEFVMN